MPESRGCLLQRLPAPLVTTPQTAQSFMDRDEGQRLLREMAPPLATYLASKRESLMVSGFTDDLQMRGVMRSYQDNWELSMQRALTVVRGLREAGVPQEALFAAGFGENHPVAPNDTEDNRAKNRRVEMSPVPRPQPLKLKLAEDVL